MPDLQLLSREIQNLQLRIGRINNQRATVNPDLARCQTQINKLRNIQAGFKNQASPGAQKLRVELTMWENRMRTATTQFQNLGQSLEATVNQRRAKQARLEQLQKLRREQTAAMAAQRSKRTG